MMLEWLGERHDAPALLAGAQSIRDGIDRAFGNGLVRPTDVGGSDGTAAITGAVIEALQ
jgi:3-isopropylmalate dehydrogenase